MPGSAGAGHIMGFPGLVLRSSAWPGLSPNNLMWKQFPQWQVGIAITSDGLTVMVSGCAIRWKLQSALEKLDAYTDVSYS